MTQSIIHVPRRFVRDEWGGTETVIQEIAKRQQLSGFAPKVVTSLALAAKAKETIEGIPVERHRYCYPYLGLSAENRLQLDKKGGNLLSLPLLTALLKEESPRIFHAHSLKRLGGTVATAARIRRKPVVVSLHGGVFDVPSSEIEGMSRPVEGKWEWGKPFGALLGSRSLLERADMVICVGDSEAQAAARQLSHDRVSYLPNGVDTGKFEKGDPKQFREKHKIPRDATLILNVGRIDAQKNQLGLVESFQNIARDTPSVHLALIGPETQPEYAGRLRSRIKDSGVADQITLIPGLAPDDPDLLSAYRGCDIFALPSSHEPFGIAALEAWSASKPVVANAVGGLRTLIRDGRTGLLADSGTAFSHQLRTLVKSPELRLQLADEGRREALRFYDWSIIEARLEGLYREAERFHQSKQQSSMLARNFLSPTHG
ncbi:MAG: glycosyltransferase family 4 protein [Verrucomicrobiales bacterium]|nr:glycosyltransferase family 4 protein [Verrucomicrobiales bacterium]